jgi:hypothetical protein
MTNNRKKDAMKTVTIDGVEYVRRTDPKDTQHHIVRSRDAGVFAGTIESRDGSEVTLTDARRIWYWDGAATLSELAMKGTSKPKTCKFPAPVDRVVLLGVCEILDMSDEAWASISAVPVWSMS